MCMWRAGNISTFFFDAAVRKQTLRSVPQILDCTASTLLWLGRSTLWEWMLAPTRQGHWSCCPKMFKVLLCPKKYCPEPHISKQPYIYIYIIYIYIYNICIYIFMLFLKNYPISMKWNVARWFLAPYKGTVAHSHKFAPKIFCCYAAVFQSSLPSNLPRHPSHGRESPSSFWIG